MPRRHSSAALLLAALASSIATAARADGPIALQEVSVTATREAQPLVETPASVGIITGETIQEVKPTHPWQIMNQVPGFVGTAVAVPVTNLLTLLAFSGYMFYLNPLLATLSIAIYPLVALVVPKLQSKSNQANKERVDITRTLSGKIGETITGIHEVHGNGSFRIENRKYGEFVDQLFKVRVIWNLYRFAIKVINNLFQNLGPFILFIVDGYLAINGRFDLGALVAFLSAYEKLYDPWRELMDFYQVYQDAKVSYRQTVDYFDVAP